MKIIDLQKQSATVTSAATITLGAALDKCRTVGQAIDAGEVTIGDIVGIFRRDPATGAFESGPHKIDSKTQLTRQSITSSSNNGQAVNFGGVAIEVYSAAPASFVNSLLSAADGVTGSQLTAIASVVKLLAIDSAGNIGVASASAASSFLNGTTPTPVDATSPTAPTNLASNTVTANSFNITFTPGTDNVGVARSEWSLDGTTYTALAAGATSFAVTGRSASTTYQVRVRTIDTSGNVSSPATLSVTTAAASGSADTTAPTMAGSINTSNVTATGFTMSYSAGSDNVGVALYQVSTDGGTTWIDNGTNTSYTKSDATASTTYPLRARCKDAAGNISNVLSGTVTTSAAAATLASQYVMKISADPTHPENNYPYCGVPTTGTTNGSFSEKNVSGRIVRRDDGSAFPSANASSITFTWHTSKTTPPTLASQSQNGQKQPGNKLGSDADFPATFQHTGSLFVWGPAGTYYLWVFFADGSSFCYDNGSGTPIALVLTQ